MLVNKSITYPCTVGTVDSTYHIYICVEQNISYLQQSTFLSIRRKAKRSMRVLYRY